MADGFNAAKKYAAIPRPESLDWGLFEVAGLEVRTALLRSPLKEQLNAFHDDRDPEGI
jgi:hypothetical protein